MISRRSITIAPGSERARIIDLIRQCPEGHATTRELVELSHLPQNKVSSIASKLAAYGFLKIVGTQDRPSGQLPRENIWGVT